MSGAHAALLQRAISYALDAVDAVTPAMLARPTPCCDWDLRMLLRHACESSITLHEGLATGRIGLQAAQDDTTTDPTCVFRTCAGRLRDRWTTDQARVIAIADCRIVDTFIADAGALEFAVHGWDVSQAIGECRPIPPDLASDLLAMARSLVPVADRRPLFAPPVPVSPEAGPGERLVAYLGRAPRCNDRATMAYPTHRQARVIDRRVTTSNRTPGR
jgi:uncharacterized protein (TIGR03086 family)